MFLLHALAYGEDGSAIGVATLATAFALYAQGDHGIINEMYVVPEYRSAGVGTAMIDAMKDHGREPVLPVLERNRAKAMKIGEIPARVGFPTER